MLYTFCVYSKKDHSHKLIIDPEKFTGSEIFFNSWTQWRWYFYDTVKYNWKIQILLFFLHALHLYFLKLFHFGLISDELWSYGKIHMLKILWCPTSFHFILIDDSFLILVSILLVEIWFCMAQFQSCTCWAALLPFFPFYSSSRISLNCLIYLPIIIFSPKPTLYSIANFI